MNVPIQHGVYLLVHHGRLIGKKLQARSHRLDPCERRQRQPGHGAPGLGSRLVQMKLGKCVSNRARLDGNFRLCFVEWIIVSIGNVFPQLVQGGVEG